MKNTEKKRRIRDKESHQATIVGAAAVITGNLGGQGDYIVFGRIEGDADIEGTVVVETSADWKGDISATHIVIAGRVQGDVTATEGLELAVTARVTGHVTGRSVAIAEGAVLDGEMSMQASDKVAHFRERRQS